MEPYRRDTTPGSVHDPDSDRPENGDASGSAVDDIRTVYDPSRPNWAGDAGGAGERGLDEDDDPDDDRHDNDGLGVRNDVNVSHARNDDGLNVRNDHDTRNDHDGLDVHDDHGTRNDHDGFGTTDDHDGPGVRDEHDRLDEADQRHAVDRGSDDLTGRDDDDSTDSTDSADRADRASGLSTGAAGDPDPAHHSPGLGDARSEDASDEQAAAGGRATPVGQTTPERDLMVYPEEADYPTRADDAELSAVPQVEPEPVSARDDLDERSGETHAGVPYGTGTTTGLDSVAGVGTTAGEVGTAAAGTAVSGGTGGSDRRFGAEDFERRWREVQVSFVDDPREAVERADGLVDEAVAAITSRKQALVDQWKDGDQNDTERLRLALRDYRSLLQDLVGLSYSGAPRSGGPADTK
ncbi:hypothetical protein ABZU32_08775 [Sphaerisporangium sp. NPDC005288]|uniref:hypothetical protein n=1 Tax=Sphaerisporangium sp. NPDC005288 TaxID=3155114 RepID=UPI00339DD3F5